MRLWLSSQILRGSLAVFAIALFADASTAQSQLDWLRAHDGPLGLDDYANACAVDSAGNLYAAGSVNSSTTRDIALAKYSPSGVLLWSAYADIFGYADSAQDCAISPTGDVYVCGATAPTGASTYELVLLKYSSAGALQWTRTLAVSSSDSAYLLDFDLAGNVLVAGTANSAATQNDVLLASYTPAGAFNWSTRLDGSAHGWDFIEAITVLEGGDIAVVGRTEGVGTGYDFTVWKLTANGASVWTTSLDAGAGGFDGATAIVESSPAKLIACGFATVSGATQTDWMIVELDAADGSVGWTNYYGGPELLNDSATNAAIDSTGHLWICGGEYSLATKLDIVVRRLSTSGALLSTAKWSYVGSGGDEIPDALLLGTAGQAWVCGIAGYGPPSAGEDAFIAQFDSAGALNWARTYSTSGAFQDRPVDMALAPNDRIAMGGYTTGGPSGTADFLALQVDLSESPQAYCTAKTTSNGCVPRVSFVGMPSAGASSGFVVRAEQVRNQKNGLLFYGVSGGLANPFQGGTLCVAPPTVRTAIQGSGGSALPTDDCSGAFALDMNAYASGALGGAPLPVLSIAGTAVSCQFWGRDPGFPAPQNTMLANALRYVVLP